MMAGPNVDDKPTKNWRDIAVVDAGIALYCGSGLAEVVAGDETTSSERMDGEVDVGLEEMVDPHSGLRNRHFVSGRKCFRSVTQQQILSYGFAPATLSVLAAEGPHEPW